MTLAEFTCPELCLPALSGRSVESVLLELSDCLHGKLMATSQLACFGAALNQCYSGEGDRLGWIAHRWARLPTVETTIFAAGRAAALVWQPGLPPVNLVMLIAAPCVPSARDLSLLAAIRRLADNFTALPALRTANRARDIFDVFKRISADTAPISRFATDGRQAAAPTSDRMMPAAFRPAAGRISRAAGRHRR